MGAKLVGHKDSPDGFEYNGVGIHIDREGQFVAEINGEVVTKPSLKAMKDFIKEHKTDTFEPFTALLSQKHSLLRGHEAWQRVTVVGFRRTKNRTHGSLHEFLLKEYPTDVSRSRWNVVDSLVRDTPENRKLLEKIEKHDEESERIDEKRRLEKSEMEDKITHVDVTEFVKDI